MGLSYTYFKGCMARILYISWYSTFAVRRPYHQDHGQQDPDTYQKNGGTPYKWRGSSYSWHQFRAKTTSTLLKCAAWKCSERLSERVSERVTFSVNLFNADHDLIAPRSFLDAIMLSTINIVSGMVRQAVICGHREGEKITRHTFRWRSTTVRSNYNLKAHSDRQHSTLMSQTSDVY